jgi:hypothetical protein
MHAGLGAVDACGLRRYASKAHARSCMRYAGLGAINACGLRRY